MKPRIEVLLRIKTRHRKKGRAAHVTAAVEQALLAGKPEILNGAHAHALSIVLSDDTHLRELNHTYRGYDKPTDVLSFEGQASGDRYLGDVIISMDRVAAQAAKSGHVEDDELALLVIHGTLHLTGHDHMTAPDKAVMWVRQKQAIRALQDAGYVSKVMKLPR